MLRRHMVEGHAPLGKKGAQACAGGQATQRRGGARQQPRRRMRTGTIRGSCMETCRWCLATALRRVQQRRATACDNGTTAHNNKMRRLGLQSAADSEGMRQGGMRLPWPDARVAVWLESLHRGNRSEQRKGAGLGGYRAP
jgi:hypothetical protein